MQRHTIPKPDIDVSVCIPAQHKHHFMNDVVDSLPEDVLAIIAFEYGISDHWTYKDLIHFSSTCKSFKRAIDAFWNTLLQNVVIRCFPCFDVDVNALTRYNTRSWLDSFETIYRDRLTKTFEDDAPTEDGSTVSDARTVMKTIVTVSFDFGSCLWGVFGGDLSKHNLPNMNCTKRCCSKSKMTKSLYDHRLTSTMLHHGVVEIGFRHPNDDENDRSDTPYRNGLMEELRPMGVFNDMISTVRNIVDSNDRYLECVLKNDSESGDARNANVRCISLMDYVNVSRFVDISRDLKMRNYGNVDSDGDVAMVGEGSDTVSAVEYVKCESSVIYSNLDMFGNNDVTFEIVRDGDSPARFFKPSFLMSRVFNIEAWEDGNGCLNRIFDEVFFDACSNEPLMRTIKTHTERESIVGLYYERHDGIGRTSGFKICTKCWSPVLLCSCVDATLGLLEYCSVTNMSETIRNVSLSDRIRNVLSVSSDYKRSIDAFRLLNGDVTTVMANTGYAISTNIMSVIRDHDQNRASRPILDLCKKILEGWEVSGSIPSPSLVNDGGLSVEEMVRCDFLRVVYALADKPYEMLEDWSCNDPLCVTCSKEPIPDVFPHANRQRYCDRLANSVNISNSQLRLDFLGRASGCSSMPPKGPIRHCNAPRCDAPCSNDMYHILSGGRCDTLYELSRNDPLPLMGMKTNHYYHFPIAKHHDKMNVYGGFLDTTLRLLARMVFETVMDDNEKNDIRNTMFGIFSKDWLRDISNTDLTVSEVVKLSVNDVDLAFFGEDTLNRLDMVCAFRRMVHITFILTGRSNINSSRLIQKDVVSEILIVYFGVKYAMRVLAEMLLDTNRSTTALKGDGECSKMSSGYFELIEWRRNSENVDRIERSKFKSDYLDRVCLNILKKTTPYESILTPTSLACLGAEDLCKTVRGLISDRAALSKTLLRACDMDVEMKMVKALVRESERVNGSENRKNHIMTDLVKKVDDGDDSDFTHLNLVSACCLRRVIYDEHRKTVEAIGMLSRFAHETFVLKSNIRTKNPMRGLGMYDDCEKAFKIRAYDLTRIKNLTKLNHVGPYRRKYHLYNFCERFDIDDRLKPSYDVVFLGDFERSSRMKSGLSESICDKASLLRRFVYNFINDKHVDYAVKMQNIEKIAIHYARYLNALPDALKLENVDVQDLIFDYQSLLERKYTKIGTTLSIKDDVSFTALSEGVHGPIRYFCVSKNEDTCLWLHNMLFRMFETIGAINIAHSNKTIVTADVLFSASPVIISEMDGSDDPRYDVLGRGEYPVVERASPLFLCLKELRAPAKKRKLQEDRKIDKEDGVNCDHCRTEKKHKK